MAYPQFNGNLFSFHPSCDGPVGHESRPLRKTLQYHRAKTDPKRTTLLSFLYQPVKNEQDALNSVLAGISIPQSTAFAVVRGLPGLSDGVLVGVEDVAEYRQDFLRLYVYTESNKSTEKSNIVGIADLPV